MAKTILGGISMFRKLIRGQKEKVNHHGFNKASIPNGPIGGASFAKQNLGGKD